MAVWIVVAVVVLVALVLIFSFNGLVPKRTGPRRRGREIDVELKRRHDLIPNLVETVKGYAAHERADLRGCHHRPGRRRPGRRHRRSGQDRCRPRTC